MEIELLLLRSHHMISMLGQIEIAADALPPKQKQELFLFLAMRLRAETNELPSPREFSGEQIAAWIVDDEEGMRRFQEGR